VSANQGGWQVELAQVAVVSLLALLILYFFATERAGLFKDDTRHYGLMAEDPSYLPRLPYAFRVLTPTLVHLLPLDTATGFSVVTLVALWLSAVVLYFFLRRLGCDRWSARSGVVLFLGCGATIRLLTTPTYVDGLTYLTELAAFACLACGRERLLALTLTLGVLNRETALLLIPVYLLERRAAGRLSRFDLPRAALVAGLPLVALLAVAKVKISLAGGPGVALAALETKPRTFVQNVPSFQDLADIYAVFGAAWLLAPFALRQAPPLLRRGLIFGALVVAQLLVSRGDESRNLSHLLVLILPLTTLELRRQVGPGRLTVALACLVSTVNYRWVVLPNIAVRYLLVALSTVTALGLTVWRHRPGAGDTTSPLVPGRSGD
jgi:hypothetical protein